LTAIDLQAYRQAESGAEWESALKDRQIDTVPPASKVEPDPRNEILDDCWDQFKAAELEGRTERFIQMLDQPSWIAEELAVEMLDTIRGELLQRDERPRFAILIGAFHERLPEVYAQKAPYLVSWLVEDALAERRWDDVAALGKEMAAAVEQNADMFGLVLDQLAYHGQLATLVEMLRIAWPLAKGSHNILPWGIDDLQSKAIWFETLHYCEHASSPRPDDPQLRQRLEFYTDSLRPEWLAEVMEILTGEGAGSAPPNDTDRTQTEEASPRPPKHREKKRRRWYRLSLEFLRYAFREEGVPYAKGELARVRFLEYFKKRKNGDLQRDSIFSILAPRRTKKEKPRPLPKHLVLCPDRSTLDRYLGRLAGMFGQGHYEVAAVMDLLPAWLRFLRRRELIDAEQHAAVFKQLARLKAELLAAWRTRLDDPAVYEGLLRAWQQPPDIPAASAANAPGDAL